MKDILLVMSDQQGQAYTAVEDERIETPELLRIAGEGVYYDRCYCNPPSASLPACPP